MLLRMVGPKNALEMYPGLSARRNARNVTERPALWPGYVLISGDAEDDSSIPSHAQRQRVERLHFQDVMVREDASSFEIRAAINQQIPC
jgi:hypothetical protein